MAQAVRQVTPFPTCDTALDNCMIDPGLNVDQRLSADSWSVTTDDVSDGFNPIFNIEVDWQQITRETGINTAELSLAIRHKNSDARLFNVLEHWDSGEEDDVWAPETALHLGANFDLGIAVYSVRPIGYTGQTILWPGSVIASKSIHCGKRGYGFPVEYADFELRGWPPNALMHVEIDHELVNNPPEDCLTVFLNEKLKSLYESSRRDIRAARDVFTRTCAAMIFASVARHVLTADISEDEDQSGLVDVVVSKLNSNSELTIVEWRRMLEDTPDRLEQTVQDALGSADTVASYGR